jgi:hypothetical protein
MRYLMRRSPAVTLVWIVAFAIVSCAKGPSVRPVASGTSSGAVARVDLLEAGIRAVAQPSRVLLVQTRLCPDIPVVQEDCPATMTHQETAIIAERLVDLSKDVRFVPTFEATYGTVPDKVSRDYIMLDVPQDRGDGTYWIEAGEVSCEMCAHGGTYVLELRDGTWVSTGNAPGTGMWVS